METVLARLARTLYRVSVAMAWLFVDVAVLAIVAGGVGAWRQALLFAALAPLAHGIGLFVRRIPGAAGGLRTGTPKTVIHV